MALIRPCTIGHCLRFDDNSCPCTVGHGRRFDVIMLPLVVIMIIIIVPSLSQLV